MLTNGVTLTNGVMLTNQYARSYVMNKMHFTFTFYCISIDPYICFVLCKNHHQGVQNYVHSTSNVNSGFILVQYLCMQVTFTYNIRI